MALKKKYCFIYKTTNLINNKVYVGLHCTNKLDDGYLGSGNLIKRAIKKYGKKNFKREIIEMCLPCDIHISYREQYFIKVLNSQIPNGYNITIGGNGVNSIPFTEEHKDKIRENSIKHNTIYNLQECPYCRRVINQTNAARWHFDRCKENPNCDWEGRKCKERSKEWCNKLSTTTKNFHKTNPKRFDNYKKISKSNLGRKDSLETREKKSKAREGDKNPMYGRNHTNLVKDIIRKKRLANSIIYKSDDFRKKQSIINSMGNNNRAKVIVDIVTGKEYSCIKEAYLESNFEKSIITFRRYIKLEKLPYIYK